MFHAQLQILTLTSFLLFHYAIPALAANLPILNLPHDDNIVNPNLNQGILVLVFGRGNTIATSLILVITLLNIIVYKLRKFQEENLGDKLNIPSSLPLEQLCRRFSLTDILSATHNFDDELVIGRGGFGKVYKGVINDGGNISVAIKRLSPMSKQGAPQFWMEIELLSKFRHSHLVSLIGYCIDRGEMILIYEYMVRGALFDHLRSGASDVINSTLSWVQRLKICIGAARGLDYLHTGTGVKHRVIHRDIKSSNILLDENWVAKISDFGLCKIGPANQSCTHVSTNIKGTCGYMDPEYLWTRKLTRKSDVYSFGVVLFEVLCGRRVKDLKLHDEQWGLAGWAQSCIKNGTVDQIIDPNLGSQIFPNSLRVFLQIADQCLHYRSKKRPTMAEVVASLESSLALQERKDSSMFEGEIFDMGGDYETQDNAGNSIEQHNAINVDNAQLDDASRRQSRVKPGRVMGFTKMVRLFHVGKAQITSAGQDPEIHLGQLKKFSLHELQVATDNFSNKNILDRGGFGKVYKGRLTDGSLVAVKRLKVEHTQGGELQFQTEVKRIGMVVHRNLLPPRGFCVTPEEQLLVYPYMANGSLQSCLRERPESQSPIDWSKRRLIALGSARGLSYLHDHCDPKIIHRNVKAANILLDEEFEAVVGDFGLDDKDVTTFVCGTVAHIAPEYFSTGESSEKTDVFGYGAMLLELVTGHMAFNLALRSSRINNGDNMLFDWVKRILKEKKYQTLVDASMHGNFVDKEVDEMIQVALLCTHGSPLKRPNMSEVVRMLEGDGLAKKWEEYSKDEMVHQELNNTPIADCTYSLNTRTPSPTYDPRIDFNITYPAYNPDIDSTNNLSPDELSGPR